MNSLLIIWDVRSFIFKMATLTLNLYLTTIEQKCRLQDYYIEQVTVTLLLSPIYLIVKQDLFAVQSLFYM